MGLTHGDGLEVDHINGVRLDNRRANLRVVSHADGHQNLPGWRTATSRHRNVSLDRQSGKWVAAVRLNGRQVWLGYHEDEEQAAQAARGFRQAHLPYAVDR